MKIFFITGSVQEIAKWYTVAVMTEKIGAYDLGANLEEASKTIFHQLINDSFKRGNKKAIKHYLKNINLGPC